MKFIYALLMVALLNYYTLAQEKVALYDVIPNATVPKEGLNDENIPVLYRYEVEGSKQGMLIIPGGGYSHVAINHEGHEVAKEFNKHGISAFVLYYRLPKDETMPIRKIGPLQDAQRAMQYIRETYAFDRVGVIGFSAGGHLAATLSNHFEDTKIENPKQTNLRPDFSVLIYPVISMRDEVTHQGSKEQLIGVQAEEADVRYYSLDEQVSKKTPPTFLVHAHDDKAVVFANASRYQEALNEFGIANELFAYQVGGHGFGLLNKSDARRWSDRMFIWLNELE
ncbi:alpha/beta hydrolase [Sphingobacterium griseoflavum]|uniref:Pectin acetylesterase n=1 Tax=Sphingobacterium griseoflavum TaxID=1474952 RepID=A0ABQ3HXZ3_9SPHI|nr:alpha/beta hydrolase [Sphingobacterium griseoflavum]GHE37218.1 pectin acetylesterase [Sphingobacterium griseoflavum]